MLFDFDLLFTIDEEFYARAIGWEVLKYAKEYDQHLLARRVECDAVELIKEIQKILDDEVLDDEACFLRMDAIVSAFGTHGLATKRHYELE